MRKRIVFISYYFEPDLCAGSFRNASLLNELRTLLDNKTYIDVYTTKPNRYHSFSSEAEDIVVDGNVRIFRISTPEHDNKMWGQIIAFKKFFVEVIKLNRDLDCDLIYASSSRLFTAFLGAVLSKKKNAFLYVDIRDIFKETIIDTLQTKIMSKVLSPMISLIENYTFRQAKHINLISPGFQEYFNIYHDIGYSYYTNGIDDIFLSKKINPPRRRKKVTFEIIYAGNIGWSQGLHKVVPIAAKELGEKFRFTIIGDGGAKPALIEEIHRLQINNVNLFKPVQRDKLLELYDYSDCMLIHLEKKPAFEKVIPSKIFELATYDKPIVAGVSGYPKTFIESNLKGTFIFEPCNPFKLVESILKAKKTVIKIDRNEFINKYSRKNININMAKSILDCLNS